MDAEYANFHGVRRDPALIGKDRELVESRRIKLREEAIRIERAHYNLLEHHDRKLFERLSADQAEISVFIPLYPELSPDHFPPPPPPPPLQSVPHLRSPVKETTHQMDLHLITSVPAPVPLVPILENSTKKRQRENKESEPQLETHKDKEQILDSNGSIRPEPVKNSIVQNSKPVEKSITKKPEPVKNSINQNPQLVMKSIMQKCEPVENSVTHKPEPVINSVTHKPEPVMNSMCKPVENPIPPNPKPVINPKPKPAENSISQKHKPELVMNSKPKPVVNPIPPKLKPVINPKPKSKPADNSITQKTKPVKTHQTEPVMNSKTKPVVNPIPPKSKPVINPKPKPTENLTTQKPKPDMNSVTHQTEPVMNSVTHQTEPVMNSKPKPVVNPIPPKLKPVINPKPKPAENLTTQKPKPVMNSITQKPKPVDNLITQKPKTVINSITPKPKPLENAITQKPKPVINSDAQKPKPVENTITPKPKPVMNSIPQKRKLVGNAITPKPNPSMNSMVQKSMPVMNSKPKPVEDPTTQILKPVENPTTKILKPVENPTTKILKPVENPTTKILKPVENPTTKMEYPTTQIQKPVENPTTHILKSVEEPTTHIPKPVENPTGQIPKPVENPTGQIPKPVENSTTQILKPVVNSNVQKPKPVENPITKILIPVSSIMQKPETKKFPSQPVPETLSYKKQNLMVEEKAGASTGTTHLNTSNKFEEKNTVPISGTASPHIQVIKDGWFCTLCNMRNCSISNVESHLKGKMHKANLKELVTGSNQPKPTIGTSTGTAHVNTSNKFKEKNTVPVSGTASPHIQVRKAGWFCTLCNMKNGFLSNIQSHLKGKTHNANLEKLVNASNQPKSTNGTSRSVPVTATNNLVQRLSQNMWFCTLCNGKLFSTASLHAHLQGQKHQNNLVLLGSGSGSAKLFECPNPVSRPNFCCRFCYFGSYDIKDMEEHYRRIHHGVWNNSRSELFNMF